MGHQMIRCFAISSFLLALFGSLCASQVFKMSVEKKPRDDIRFAFAKHFQDHMVLQQAPAKANIYGFSPHIGQLVTLQITTSPIPIVYQTTVKPGPEPGVGVWSFTLDATPANTTISLKVASNGTYLTLSHVIFGDVWICSGQSNMEFTVNMMSPADAKKERDDAHNYPLIRLMTVERQQSTTPLYDLVKVRQPWTPPSNASIGGPPWMYFSAICWFYGKAIHKALGHPIGLIATSWGGTTVEAWSSPQALKKCGINSRHEHNANDHLSDSHSDKLLEKERLKGPDNSVLWNAMIYPMLGMTIKGAVWYQGSSDASGTPMDHYNCTFPTMIQDWRSNFNNASNGQTDPLFPFGFGQLYPNRPNPNITVGFPDIRWHQTADHGYVPNTDMINVFMAVAMDLPDFNSTYGSIHPRDKKDVGDRLALAGLAIAYGKHVVYEGPFPLNQKITSGGLVIDYGQVWNVTVRSPHGFELLCINGSKGTWIPTQIVSNNGTSVTLGLRCNAGQRTAGVRYAWRESPCEFKKCAIYETVNELPGPPFVIYLSASGRDLNCYYRQKMRKWAVTSLLALTCCLIIVTCYTVLAREYVNQFSVDLKVSPQVQFRFENQNVKAQTFFFAKHFQSHMVLQQAPQRANIYGFASTIGAPVTLELITAGEVYHYNTAVKQHEPSALGYWSVKLRPMQTNQTVSIRANSSGVSRLIEDVLFGDVWLCSGQSNMVFNVQAIFGGAEVISNSTKYPNIRYMTVYREGSTTPLDDLKAVAINWTPPVKGSVAAFSAVCWLYGQAIHKALGYPVGLVELDYSGTPVAAWSSPQALAKCGVLPDKSRLSRRPDNSMLWNAMVHPLLGMTIYGAIWYQGEEDSNRTATLNRYNCTFPAMIDDWRLQFNEASFSETSNMFPFGFVQLAPSMPPSDPWFPDIRWHQTADVGYVPNDGLKNVFMAVAMDLPDFNAPTSAIHPRHKREIGYRLSLGGLAVAYHKPEVFQGPFPAWIKLESNNSLVVNYGDQWQLSARNTQGFELLCTAGNRSTMASWVSSRITRTNSTQVTLLASVCGEGQHILGLRYAWTNTPCALKSCAVYSTVNELPAPPFVAFAQDVDGKLLFNFGKR